MGAGMTVDRTTFVHYVREALRRLYDRPYLRAHPLAQLLTDSEQDDPGAALHSIIAEALHYLEPPPTAPPSSIARRRYRYLVLRYLEGMSHEETARELLVGVRQARRYHDDAIQDLANVLWERFLQRSPERRVDGPARQQTATPRGSRGVALRAELALLSAAGGSQRSVLQQAIADAVVMVGDVAERHSVAIEAGSPPSGTVVALDSTVLHHLLLNLFTYAIAVVPGGRIEVSQYTKPVGVEVLLRCTRPVDSVVAAAAEERSEMRSLLSVARTLAETQGAKVSAIQSGADRSLLIRLSLPTTRPTTVLVIDDNPDVALLFGRYLRGYRILTARTSDLATRLAREERPDVITLDLLMPAQDGWDTLRQLRSQPETRDIPVIACSILPEQSLARSLGVVDFLAKPVTPAALRAALERCLSPQRQSAHPDSPSDSAWPQRSSGSRSG